MPKILPPSAVMFLCVGLLTSCGGSSPENALSPPPPDDIRAQYFADARLSETGIVTVVATRADGSPRVLNSERHLEAEWGIAPPPPVLPGFVSREYLLSENRSDGKTLVFASVEQNDTDMNDYLVGGWWMHFPRGTSVRDVTAAERHVYYAGPELDVSRPPDLPEAGRAIYAGVAGGLYQYDHGAGSEFVELRGTSEFAEIFAPAQLEADFDAGSITGCIGCGGPITAQTFYLYPVLPWQGDPPMALPEGYSLTLPAAPIGETGVFMAPGVTVTHATRTMDSSSGRWGGQFSNIPDGEVPHLPRRLLGVADARFTESGGTGHFNFGFGLLPAPPAADESP
ncbi:MAG: hypothetical protein OXC53_06455 [Rhodobacteraceae bacterium]|nr:hypothetical protein [Paracoccaceae bacterium]